MNRKEARELIEEGESLQIEFKRKFTSHEKIAREMIAFANTRGGFILFGVDDDKSIVGVDSEKSEADLILKTANEFCEPALSIKLDFINLDNKEIVIASIPESENKPHRLQDYKNELDINSAEVIIRVNDKSVLASKEMIRLMRAQKNNLVLKKYAIGEIEKSIFSFLSNKETITVQELSKQINISERRASRALVKLVRANLLMLHVKHNGDEYFTNAS